MTKEWNKAFSADRGRTNSLLKAIKAVLRAEPGTTAEDFGLVVRSRLTEAWVSDRKPPLQSLIRVENFSGYLEKAKESYTPRARYTEAELAAMRKLTGGSEQ